MKILALKWRRLGDTVLWTSALAALREHYPEATIDLAMPSAYLSLFDDDPRWNERFGLSDETPWSHVRAWRKKKYDLFLNFHASSRSEWLARLSGAREKIVHHHRRRPKLGASDRAIPNLGVPMGANERDVNVIRALGWRSETPSPRLFTSAETVARGKLALAAVGLEDPKKLVVIHPGASRPAKRWPEERFFEVVRALKDTHDCVVIGERNSISRVIPFVETPTLPDLLGVLSHAGLFVGSDSGVKHVACALGKRTLTLFGPESLGEWHFYERARHPVIQKKVLCRTNDPVPAEFAWCGAEICPLSSHACLTQISPEEVLTSIRSIL